MNCPCIGYYIIGLVAFSTTFATPRYGETLCHEPGYHCLHVQSHDSWESLFPNPEQLDLVQRLNRMNIELKKGIILAVPLNLEHLSLADLSPFPLLIPSQHEKIIYIDQHVLAFGAYDEQGKLVFWGPISSGSGVCHTSDRCQTPEGEFRIIRKQDESCVSTVFYQTIDGFDDGFPMPYCMHFLMGYALHGSDHLPGYRASHGCIRLLIEDAQWLNEQFIDLPGAGGYVGTRVIIGGVEPH